MPLTVLNIQEVNTLITDHFIRIFGNVVDQCPAAAIWILKYRPFEDATAISNAINDYLDKLHIQDKEKILQYHQDFVSHLVDLAKINFNCYKNKNIIPIDKLPLEEKLLLNQLNRRYKEKFGFPFITHGKRGSLTNVLRLMEHRIENNREEEIDLAIQEVKKICKLRIHEIVRN